MTFHSFQLLSSAMQLQWALRHGTYLASRCEGSGYLNLYHCADAGRGFFVEIDNQHDRLLVVRSFQRSELLEAYVPDFELPAS